MTLLALPKPGPPAVLSLDWPSRANTSASVRPRILEPPIRNNSRRETNPSQVSLPRWPGMTSMRGSLLNYRERINKLIYQRFPRIVNMLKRQSAAAAGGDNQRTSGYHRRVELP